MSSNLRVKSKFPLQSDTAGPNVRSLGQYDKSPIFTFGRVLARVEVGLVKEVTE